MSMKIGWIELKREIKKELDFVYITTDHRKFAEEDIAIDHQTIIDRLYEYESQEANK